jgi:hypothetical protein
MKLERIVNLFLGGDGGDVGDTLRLQWPRSSPLRERRLGTMGTRSTISIQRPHVPTIHFGSGDATNQMNTEPSPMSPVSPNKTLGGPRTNPNCAAQLRSYRLSGNPNRRGLPLQTAAGRVRQVCIHLDVDFAIPTTRLMSCATPDRRGSSDWTRLAVNQVNGTLEGQELGG